MNVYEITLIDDPKMPKEIVGIAEVAQRIQQLHDGGREFAMRAAPMEIDVTVWVVSRRGLVSKHGVYNDQATANSVVERLTIREGRTAMALPTEYGTPRIDQHRV